MLHCDTLIAPRWCAPVAPANGLLVDPGVVVNDGRIADILPIAEARLKYQPSVFIERPEHLLIPGFVNTHTHAAMTLMRGLADDMPLETWLGKGIWPVEKRWVGAEMVRDGTELAIAEMISGGTTCFSDQYFFPEIVAETAVDLQMRAMVGTPIIEFPTAWASTFDEYLNKASDLVHDPYVDHPLVSTCFAPHSANALSDESFVELRVLADQLDVRIQMHLHESASEIERAWKKNGQRPIERLQKLGLVNTSLLAVHAIHLTDVEIEIFAASGVHVAHCPKSNLKLASGIAPIAKYRRAGIKVAIGTDGAASNNCLDMLEEMRATALLAKAQGSDPAALTASDALRMATLGGAEALGLAQETGSIEAGKWADLACVDLNRLHSQPLYDPISQLVYTARAEQVTDVWVAGRHQLDKGRLTQIDTASLMARCNEWRDRFASSTN